MNKMISYFNFQNPNCVFIINIEKKKIDTSVIIDKSNESYKLNEINAFDYGMQRRVVTDAGGSLAEVVAR